MASPQNLPIHTWLQKINVAWVPGPATPLLQSIAERLLECFRQAGHTVLSQPGGPPGADVILTSAAFNQPIHYRDSLTIGARRKYHLDHAPQVFTLLHARPAEWQALLAHLERSLAPAAPDPADFAFPGLAGMAYHTLFEQGKRGGPLMAVVRIVQSQAKSIRNILVVGDEDRPVCAYTFDMVGGYPRTDFGSGNASDGRAFFTDLMYRIVTAASTHEITRHTVVEPPIPRETWQSLETPRAMIAAGNVLGKLGFFTEMVRPANLVDMPLIQDAIASQYSEGCYATWEPAIAALVCTITGSARPVEKDRLSDAELAVISGVRPDGQGACVRQVEGKRNDPPSSEAVEMMGMDAGLPRVVFHGKEVPVARSKLHGHRGVRSYDPQMVEHVSLEPAYYTYPVSCSTEAQARAIRAAFSHAQALQNPADPRKIVFTILPGHGVFIVEKWVEGKAPFAVIWEAMEDGKLEIVNSVPQGPVEYRLDSTGYNLSLHINKE